MGGREEKSGRNDGEVVETVGRLKFLYIVFRFFSKKEKSRCFLSGTGLLHS